VILIGAVAAVATIPIIARAGTIAPTANAPNVDTKCRGIRATIGYATQFDLSLDLTALAANASRLSTTLPRNILRRLLPLAQKTNLASILVNDPMLQAQAGDSSMPAPIANFEGMPNWNNLYPPDTEGDIGFDPSTGKKYYLQWVNTSFAIWM
jgi:hypothetical protein